MKKRILTVLIAIITVIPFVLITPKAASYSTHSNTTVTSYGQYYYSSGYNEELISYAFGVEISFPISNSSYFSFTYEFKDVYNGYVSLSITAPTAFAWNTTYFYCEGCTFTQSPNMTNVGRTKTFQLQFRDSNRIQFTVIHDTSSTTTADTTFYNYTSSAFTSCNITSSNFVLQPDTPDIVNHIDNQLDIYLPGMSTSLSNIDGDLDNINQNIQALSPYIDQLESYVDGLEGYVDGLEGLLSTIRDYTNNLNYILRFNNIVPWQYNALCWPWYNTGANSVTYSYERGLIYFNYSTSNNNGTYYDPKCIKIPAYGHLGFYFYTDKAISSADVHFYASNNNTDLSGMVLQNNFFQSGGPYYKNLIHFENKSNSYIYLTLEFTKDMKIYPLFLGNINNTPDAVADLFGIEYGNTYTRLLQQISNGISALNDDYDTSEYDELEHVVDNFTDNLLVDVNNSKDNVLTDLSNQGGLLDGLHLNNVKTVVNGVYTDIVRVFPAVRYLVILGLVILVVGVMF